MGDPYRMYAAPPPAADRSGPPGSSFTGYLSPEASTLTAHRPWSSADVRYNPDLLPSRAGEYHVDGIRSIHPSTHPLDDIRRSHPPMHPVDDIRRSYPPTHPVDDIRRSYPPTHPLDDIRGIHPEPGLDRFPIGASIRGYPSPMRDPSLLERRPDIPPDVGPGFYDIDYERQNSHKTTSGLPPPAKESNILLVDGLPTDCSRREVGHLFRPFIGFREVKVVHKEPRRTGDKALVLCFVEFTDSKCALTAMEALQGYKFDDKKPESGILKISFAHFPLRRPSDPVHQ